MSDLETTFLVKHSKEWLNSGAIGNIYIDTLFIGCQAGLKAVCLQKEYNIQVLIAIKLEVLGTVYFLWV